MTLNEEQRRSALWAVLKQHYEERLDMLRRQNDGKFGEAETARLRGRIAEVKELLNLGKDKPKVEIEPYTE